MGSCCKACCHERRDELLNLTEGEIRLLGRRQTLPLSKHFAKAYNTKRNVELFQAAQMMVDIWETYLSNASPTCNIFTGTDKCPQVKFMFRDNHRFERHLNIVQNMIGNCLMCVVRGDLMDMSLALFNLGTIHAQRGVTADQFHNFITTFSTAIWETNKNQHEEKLQMEKVFMKDFLSFVVNIMQEGAHQYENAVTYISMLVDKTGSFIQRKRVRRKLVGRLVSKSWEKMAKQLSK